MLPDSLIAAILVPLALLTGCAAEHGFCDGEPIELRSASEPVVRTQLTCTGSLEGLCDGTSIGLSTTCGDDLQVQVLQADLNAWVAVNVSLADGRATSARALYVTGSHETDDPGTHVPATDGWIALTSIERCTLAGSISIAIPDGTIEGEFAIAANDPPPNGC